MNVEAMRGDELLSMTMAARRLGLSVRKVYYMVDAGELHAVYIDAKKRRGMRIRLSELDAFIAGRPEVGA